jgi:hypothetical protein
MPRIAEFPIKTFDAADSALDEVIGVQTIPEIEDCKDSMVSIDLDEISSVAQSFYPDRCSINMKAGESFLVFSPYKTVRDHWTGKNVILLIGDSLCPQIRQRSVVEGL